MTATDITHEIHKEIKQLINLYGKSNIEFFIGSQCSPVKPVAKTVIWYNSDQLETKRIYQSTCTRFSIPYDETLTGQYIFIKLG